MEGRITKKFLDIQSHHLMDAEGYLSGHDWVKTFISKILQITHSQWIFRNMTLHDRNGGKLRRREAQKMRSEAENFAHMDPMGLKKQDRWLLELDGEKYVRGDGHHIDKCYYIAAARAAIQAGKRKVKYRRQQRSSLHCRRTSTEDKRRDQKRRSECVEAQSDAVGRFVRRKKHMVSEAHRMTRLKSNRSYLPGD